MFGKPQWFKRKVFGWGLTPVSWQGWVYTLVWVLVMTGPFTFFISSEKVIEAMVWIVASIGALVWDVKKTLDAMEQEDRKNLFFIDEDQKDAKVAARNYDLQVRE